LTFYVLLIIVWIVNGYLRVLMSDDYVLIFVRKIL
jgi:hypothetical protein